MFLVRIKVATASGAPIRDVRMRVGIALTSATSPSSSSPSMLQSLASQGKKLGIVASGSAELDPETTVRVSKPDGVINFPLTVTRAVSGAYQLKFQPEVPDAEIVLETSPFKVENPIHGISSVESKWGEVEVPDFSVPVTIPRTPKFCVETSTNESLEQLQSAGVRTRIRLILKGAPSQQESAATRLVSSLKEEANQVVRTSANRMASKLSEGSTGFVKEAVDRFVASSASPARGSFAGLSPEFAEACMRTPLKMMQVGDPSLSMSFGNQSLAEFAVLQAPSVAEALGVDAAALDPTQVLNQFSEVLMSGGASTTSPSDKVAKAQWEFVLEDLVFEEPCSYSFVQPLEYAFVENMEYAFTVAVNGVESVEGFDFKVVKTPPNLWDVAFNWFCSAVAGIVGVIILTTNVTKHRWCWFIFAIMCTVGMLAATPFLTLHQDAMYGAWLYFAVVNLVLILISLFWGMGTEVVKKGSGRGCHRTFEQQRLAVFEAYSKRRLKQALSFQAVPADRTVRQSVISSARRTFLTPFNEEDAFFFPSALLVANILAFLSFAYIFAQSFQILWSLEEALNLVLNTAVDKSVSLISSVNRAYFQLARADLPDGATSFMYVQIDTMRLWFQQLVDAIIRGFAIGIVVASLLTMVALLGQFVHFRQSVMDARLGKFNFKKADAKIVFATTFIGINISSAIVSYILIVGLVTLILLPFFFALTWKVIWRSVPYILTTFVVPKIISFVSMKICKKCIFGPTFIKTRAGASIFHFYMTFLALPGGVVTAITRFVMGLLGVLVMLPVTYGANTPSFINGTYLLDSSYRTYIAYVMLFSCHNNPIMITAAQRMLAIKDAREATKKEGKVWTSSRSLLILILIRFPHLRKWRKHVLAEEKQLKDIQSKAKKGRTLAQVAIQDSEKPSAEPPWIESIVAEAMHEAATANRKLELIKKYRLILSGVKEDSDLHKTITEALLKLSSHKGNSKDLPVLDDVPTLFSA